MARTRSAREGSGAVVSDILCAVIAGLDPAIHDEVRQRRT
jgi:hypothetical protein